MTQRKQPNDVKTSKNDGRTSDNETNTANSADKRARQLAGLKPFQPGQSGNPSGRPPIPPEVKAIFEAVLPETARQLAQMATSDPDPVIRLKAIDMIHNRLLGRPMQQIDANVKTESVAVLHLQALQDIAARREARLAGVVDVTPAIEVDAKKDPEAT